jgi:hypothetical protein
MWVFIFALIILILGAVYFKSETPKPCPCNKNGAST